jgi:hypothetical protein
MNTSRWWLFFALIQVVNLPLLVAGWFICLSPKFARTTWLWWNSDDPPSGTWWQQYYWLALRNPVANLRHVPGISGPNRPLIYHWWTRDWEDFSTGVYVKVGWESGPPFYPVMSGGAGRGY